MEGDRLTQILEGTYECLARYGVRRTTMDDIAGAVGVSRSALYQYVSNKDDAVRRLVRCLHDRALERARAAAESADPPVQRVQGVLDAKLALFLELSGESPHTSELLDAKTRLFGDICRDFTAELRELLAGVFAEAGTPAVEPGEAADICLALVIGLESVSEPERLLGPAADAVAAGLLRG